MFGLMLDPVAEIFEIYGFFFFFFLWTSLFALQLGKNE